MKRTFAWLTASLLMVAAIVLVAMMWVHVNHTRVIEGRHLYNLWGSHGIHELDLVVLVVELVLVMLLTITLYAGFSRPR